MSKVSTIFDKIESIVTAALPNHRELSNPYFPETSDDLGYEKAYGIAFAEGDNLDSNFNSQIEIKQRVFIVSITRRIFATKRDTSTRKTTEKNLFEDQELILKDLTNDPHLGIPSVIVKATYLNDSGIEFVRIDRQDILILRSTIQVEYHENT